ncbi:DUF4229 domain-containing protein [Phycicoccus sp. MAQZ13P-2]|uniref:DUF4229 domain-containing protein n=1 Tax=Phycicoccus mangrovi TaxID=2840470 RepID=UPI001C008974|nr:DUF4229 domain-containing protein [Phycicoccus mangrovi]MBT9256495.1 DUF4229 domain-containing protein [Phycicoccus mangrovi]MBT9275144.1 DUF4229 domain-containing protein [Phycicoccus mangrovi]
MNAFLRYTVLRLLIFFGCVLALWLAGLRSEEQLLLLVVLAALASMAISYVALRRFRQDYSTQLSETIERRAAARREKGGDRRTDEQAEDEEVTVRPSTAARQTAAEDDDFR